MGTPNALNKLNFVDAVRPRSMPPVQQRRNKLSNQLWQQIELAKSQIEHTHFVVKRRVTVKDIEGNYKSIERPKRIKPWWLWLPMALYVFPCFMAANELRLFLAKHQFR